jgi:uridine kinase
MTSLAADSTLVTVTELAAVLARTPPRLGRTRLIALDGRSGSGKTWLAELLAGRLRAPVIHMDDLYPGWSGLARAVRIVNDWVITPLATQQPARWRRFDWDAMAYAEWRTTEAADTVVLEGCGSVRAELAGAYAARIWVEAPADARRRRLEARGDWSMYQPHVQRWASQEDVLYRTERTRHHCDLVVGNARDTTGDPRLTLRVRAARTTPSKGENLR